MKMPNAEVRKLLLEEAKKLKDSQFSGIYISRDLTYAQRQDLACRRLARNASAVGGGPAGMDGARTGQSGSVVTEEAPPGPLNLQRTLPNKK
ncbi:hypothetical protein Pcinc_004607 [Petrolisthes cinctipes]|uniref:Uncharacterized protein n=1 Tax=Petrolisthes cinctipes TaxID=88211 RepID=A0AAE1L1C4_PETCI|nr:hypothetical protein Pcinc_004607 [Petrolisthes cinctipes]